MRKVSRHVLVPTGSTYTTKDSDFVVSDNLDFHPTDVIEDADGSLLIVDTGGWYKLCCPTSQLVKPDVTGAIYRVKKVGAHKESRRTAATAAAALHHRALTAIAPGRPMPIAGLTAANLHTRQLAARRRGDRRSKGDPRDLVALATRRTTAPSTTHWPTPSSRSAIAKETAKGLTHKSPRVRRACLAALENIPAATRCDEVNPIRR